MNILHNPFYILGATPRDSRNKIMELAQEKSLSLDSSIIAEARLALTTPRKRIAAEIGWFPGVSNKKAADIIKFLNSAVLDFDVIANLPALASFNVIISILGTIPKGSLSVKEVSEVIYKMAVNFEGIDTEKLIKILNEDRTVAGISEITDISSVDAELHEHKLSSVKQTQEFLKNFSQKQITAIMLSLVNKAVKNKQQLSIIDSFIDNIYAIEVQKGLQNLEDSIKASRKNIRTVLEKKTRTKSSVSSLVSEFMKDLTDFDDIMQPIQVSMQQRGTEHAASRDIADEARELAIDLLKAGEADLSEKMILKIKELFSELGSVEDRSARDLEDLQQIKNKDKEWEKSITCDIRQKNFWVDNRLSMSPKGIVYNGTTYKLEDITSIRYGVTAKYTNGVYSGTDTMVAWETPDNGYVSINWLYTPGRGDLTGNWETFVDCLWTGVGARLIFAMANELALGKDVYGIIYDNKVKLAKNNYWGPTEEKFFKWNEVILTNVAGYFGIVAKDDSKYMALLSYQEQDNVHVMERLLKIFFDTYGVRNSNSISTAPLSPKGFCITEALGVTKDVAKKQKRIDFSTAINLSSYAFILHWIVAIVAGIIFIAIIANN